MQITTTTTYRLADHLIVESLGNSTASVEINIILAKEITEVYHDFSVLEDLAIMDVKQSWDEAFNVGCDTCTPLRAARCVELDADFRYTEGEFRPHTRSDLVLWCKLYVIEGCDDDFAMFRSDDNGRGHE